MDRLQTMSDFASTNSPTIEPAGFVVNSLLAVLLCSLLGMSYIRFG